ncbi:MAG: Clp protease N-terminal domain-containing protein [Hyphomicrobiaceae bacterium]
MGYKGQDLDLRTPQTSRATPASDPGPMLNGPRHRAGYSGGEEIPIWVDDTLLACCNHAFDVALAHRSGEVRLEHLLHALTRIDEAVEALETRGINAATLRRDTVTVIADELPTAFTNGSATPRRADSLEEVLRYAAAHAYQRNAPAVVDDLLYVFLDMQPHVAGLERAERLLSAARYVRADAAEPRFRAAAQPAYVSPPREVLRERVRRTTGRFYVSDPPSAPARQQGDPVQRATDHLQNSRLDAIEDMVRALSAQIAGQRDEALLAARPEHGGPASVDITPLLPRLESIERTLSGVRSTGSIDLAPILSRLEQMERAVHAARPVADVDMAPVMLRLDQLERLVSRVGTGDIDLSALDRRLGAIEDRIDGSIAERFKALELRFDPGQISKRLDGIELALMGSDGSTSGDLDKRIREMAESAALHQTTVEDARYALSSEIGEVVAALGDQSTRIAKTGEGIQVLVGVMDDQRREDQRQIEDLRQRLLGYEARLEGLIAQSSEVLASYGEALSAHQNSVDGFARSTSASLDQHNEELSQVHDALMKLNANQHTLAGSIDQWRTDGASDLSIISTRMETLERAAGRPMALLETLRTNMEHMHRVTVERYHRRNRFWYWLFGTDDWVAASWPSQMARIEDERRALMQGQTKA